MHSSSSWLHREPVASLEHSTSRTRRNCNRRDCGHNASLEHSTSRTRRRPRRARGREPRKEEEEERSHRSGLHGTERSEIQTTMQATGEPDHQPPRRQTTEQARARKPSLERGEGAGTRDRGACPVSTKLFSEERITRRRCKEETPPLASKGGGEGGAEGGGGQGPTREAKRVSQLFPVMCL